MKKLFENWKTFVKEDLDHFGAPLRQDIEPSDAEESIQYEIKEPFKADPNSTKNEIRWRLKDPKLFSKFWRAKDKTDEGISYIKGFIDNRVSTQAIRFDKNIWSEKEAAAWWNKNKSRFTKTWTQKDWDETPDDQMQETIDHMGTPLHFPDENDYPPLNKNHWAQGLPLEEKANTNTQDYAIYVRGDGFTQDLTIILYNMKDFIKIFKKTKETEEAIKGYITAGKMKASKKFPCKTIKNSDKIWSVYGSVALDKTGPMLYDIILGMAKKNGSLGLIADRGKLSSEAENIYIQYFNRKSGATGIGVESIPLGKDCQLHKNRNPAVNNIYFVKTIPAYINKMIENHNKIIKQFSKTTSQMEIEMSLWMNGVHLLKVHNPHTGE